MRCPECKKPNSFKLTHCYWCGTLLENQLTPEYAEKLKRQMNGSMTMKEMVNGNFEVEHTIDENKPYTIRAKGAVPIVEVELEGKNGLRVMWDGPHKATIEMKQDEDGEWAPLSGVQKIEILMSVHEPLPIIKIDQIIVPGIQEKKIQGRKKTSLIADETPEDACTSDSRDESDSPSD